MPVSFVYPKFFPVLQQKIKILKNCYTWPPQWRNSNRRHIPLGNGDALRIRDHCFRWSWFVPKSFQMRLHSSVIQKIIITFMQIAKRWALIEYSIKITEARTAKIKVFVKWRYKFNLTKFLLSRNVRVVCTRDVNIHQQMPESKTARGMMAINNWFEGSFFEFMTLM